MAKTIRDEPLCCAGLSFVWSATHGKQLRTTDGQYATRALQGGTDAEFHHLQYKMYLVILVPLPVTKVGDFDNRIARLLPEALVSPVDIVSSGSWGPAGK